MVSWRARFSAMSEAPLRAPSNAWLAHSNARTAAPCCSTRSRRCGSIFRRSCCEYSRSRNSSAWVERRQSRSTCASWPRPTAISQPRPKLVDSVATCFSVSASSPSRSRLCAIGRMTSRCSRTASARMRLQRYDWPGNVRELQHAIERAVILASGPMLLPVHFDGQRFGLTQQSAGVRDPVYRIAEREPNGRSPEDVQQVILRSFDLEQAESELISRALEVTDGNRTRAAELLGLSVRALRSKLNTLRS